MLPAKLAACTEDKSYSQHFSTLNLGARLTTRLNFSQVVGAGPSAQQMLRFSSTNLQENTEHGHTPLDDDEL
jgi:hypothetical protein